MKALSLFSHLLEGIKESFLMGAHFILQFPTFLVVISSLHTKPHPQVQDAQKPIIPFR